MSAFFSINYIITKAEACAERLAALYDGASADLLQLNIFDTVCSEETREASRRAVEALGGGARCLECPGKEMASIRNQGMELSSGAFVNFCDSDVFLSAAHLSALHDICKKNNTFNIICISPYKLSDTQKEIHYFEAVKSIYKDSDNFINLCLQSYFWKRDVFKNIKFNENYVFESEFDYIIRNIANEKKYYISNIKVEVDFIFETDFYNYPDQYYLEWYSRTMKEVYIPLVKEYKKSIFVKLAVTYLVELRFACNRNNRNKNILSGDLLKEFFEVCAQVFSGVDDTILTKYNINNKKLFPKYMSLVMLKLKYRKPELLPDICTSSTELFGVFKRKIIERHVNMTMEIKAINRFGKNIIFDYEISNTYIFRKSDIEGFAKVSSKKIPFIKDSVYSLDKYFGMTMKSGFTGSVVIPKELLKSGASISFYLRYKDCTISLPVRFVKTAARLGNADAFYWRIGRYLMSYDSEHCRISVTQAGMFPCLKKELGLYAFLVRKACRRELPFGRMLRILGLRLAYWATKPFIKKEVWLSFDQLFKGGDNGEYLFRYVNDHAVDGVDMYYIINRDCEDSRRLRKTYKNVLAYNSFKLRLLSLHAAYVFATRVDVKQYCGFSNAIEEYFRDILNYRVLCLQHGLSIQQIAEYQNRIFDNTLYYFCVSEYEIKNISHPVYGYSKERLLLTGAPRYDGLISTDKRQILIAPTWRRNVTAGTNRKGEMHSYSVNFKETEYYRIYNSLINDEKLIACAKRCGYRLIYLVHPILSPQVNDFDRNDYVEILAGASGNINYEKMLSESSLMVTDHSGIQYDFAFMKKPLVYYHPDALPPQYEAKTMDYETMGFGPVCRNHESVVEAMCSYMEKNCAIEPEYERRIEAFFAFTDRNNCKRVVEGMTYIRALESARNMVKARHIAWRFAGYEVHTGDAGIDSMLASCSCRLASMAEPLRVRKFSPEGVHLEWTPAQGGKGYRLFRKIRHANEEQIAKLSAGQTTVIDTLEHDWPVEYKLIAELGDKVTATAVLQVEEPVKVARPEDVHVERLEDGSCRLVWKADPAVSGWNIRYKSAQYPNGHKVAVVPGSDHRWDVPAGLGQVAGIQVEAFAESVPGIVAYSGYCAMVDMESFKEKATDKMLLAVEDIARGETVDNSPAADNDIHENTI